MHPQIIEQFELVPSATIGTANARRAIERFRPSRKRQALRPSRSLWIGLVAPPGTPKPIIGKLTEACKAALEDKGTIDHFTKQQQPISYLDPTRFGKLINDEFERARATMDSAGLKQN